MTPVSPGQIVAGKYRVDRVLGAGGMGVVVAATHLQLDERVAIKFLMAEASENAEAMTRFGREARAAVKIRSEHVARVIDVGALENGVPYIVMEYLEGQDLSALIRDRGAMQPADAVDAVLQACEALAEAHALGIVHRDLKPANLFMIRRPDGTPSVKVLDFGISKLTRGSAAEHAMTHTKAVLGSPFYMSPEQMTASRDVDTRTDIWAIGVVLYELLSGRVPFYAETLPQICGLILLAEPPPIRTLASGVPDDLQAVVSRCLAKDRAHRFQNVSELARALTPFGSRATSRSSQRISRILGTTTVTDAPPESLPQDPGARFEPATQANWGQTNPTRSSAVPWIAAATVILVLLVGIGSFVAWRSQASSVSAASASAVSVSAVAPSTPVPAETSAGVSSASTPVVAVSAPPSPSPPLLSQSTAASRPKPANTRPRAAAAAISTPTVAAPSTISSATPPPKHKRSTEDLLDGRN